MIKLNISICHHFQDGVALPTTQIMLRYGGEVSVVSIYSKLHYNHVKVSAV